LGFDAPTLLIVRASNGVPPKSDAHDASEPALVTIMVNGGLTATHVDLVNRDLLEFLRASG